MKLWLKFNVEPSHFWSDTLHYQTGRSFESNGVALLIFGLVVGCGALLVLMILVVWYVAMTRCTTKNNPEMNIGAS